MRMILQSGFCHLRAFHTKDVNFVINVADSFYPDGVSSKDDPQWDVKWRQVYSDEVRSAAGCALPSSCSPCGNDGTSALTDLREFTVTWGLWLWIQSAAELLPPRPNSGESADLTVVVFLARILLSHGWP